MFVSIYTIWAGIQVIDGSLGLGLYAAWPVVVTFYLVVGVMLS